MYSDLKVKVVKKLFGQALKVRGWGWGRVSHPDLKIRLLIQTLK